MSTAAGRFTAVRAFPPGASVTVLQHGSTTKASLYTNSTTGTAAPNPVTADDQGSLTFFAAPGTVDLVIDVQGVAETITVPVVTASTNAWPG